MAEHSWRIADDGIVLGEVLEISLQRTLLSAPSDHDPRPSYGRAPLAAGQDVVLAGVGTGEVFWIGFQPLQRAVQVAVRVREESPRDADLVSGGEWMPALSHDPRNYLIVPPERFVSGLGPRNRRLWVEVVALRRGSDTEGRARIDSDEWSRLAAMGVHVEVLTSSEFARITGVTPSPLLETNRYQGRRYP
ncbi:hypothetical protein LuPra_04094 [Luteitalea pratensis]|uniref:Uncharacterized protein n=1 Tax=Luteitalea pratensis TaxID=1855912 RepID=A0A143PQZ3_LUTPR|nr:hypothetical protein LuPra_04094 [Luteitalea pratensis]